MVTNRMLGRVADGAWIVEHLDELKTFVDLGQGHYAFFDVVEATNAHDYERAGGTRYETGPAFRSRPSLTRTSLWGRGLGAAPPLASAEGGAGTVINVGSAGYAQSPLRVCALSGSPVLLVNASTRRFARGALAWGVHTHKGTAHTLAAGRGRA